MQDVRGEHDLNDASAASSQGVSESPGRNSSMKPLLRCMTVALVLLSAWLVNTPAFGQLYGGKEDITKGDLNDQDYWWSKFDDMMLKLALKQHQPEGRIAVDLASTNRRLDDLAKKYPKHEGIKDMRERI